jgi:hypothetical protein
VICWYYTLLSGVDVEGVRRDVTNSSTLCITKTKTKIARVLDISAAVSVRLIHPNPPHLHSVPTVHASTYSYLMTIISTHTRYKLLPL